MLSCGTCNEAVDCEDPETIVCVQCHRPYHYSCMFLSEDQVSKWESDKRDFWSCSEDCALLQAHFVKSTNSDGSPVVPDVNSLERVADQLKILCQAVASLKTTIDAQTLNFRDIFSKLSAHDEAFTNLTRVIKAQEERIVQLEINKKNNSGCLDINAELICQELSDRVRRSRNVIIYNVPEVLSKEEPTDLMKISEFLKTKQASNIKIFKAMRLGKRPSKKPRPLLVTCESQSDAFNLFAIRGDFPDPWKLSMDRTPAQREALSKLRLELEERQKNGESDITIKYIRGIPRIVTKSSGLDPKNVQ